MVECKIIYGFTRGKSPSPARGARQHGRAEIDTDNLGVARIKWKIAPGADAGIQDRTGESRKQQWPDFAIAAVLERQIEQIVEGGNPLISFECRCHGLVRK
jgi:hypothetical protein